MSEHQRQAELILKEVEQELGLPRTPEEMQEIAVELQIAQVHATLELARNVYIVAEQLHEMP